MKVYRQMISVLEVLILCLAGSALASDETPEGTVGGTVAPIQQSLIALEEPNDLRPPQLESSAGSGKISLSGEQIRWQVIGAGGCRGTSTNYALSGTVGQTASGQGTSMSYWINSGFWQAFAPTLCCVNLTGNVDCDSADGVDIGDLTALIANLFITFTPLCCEGEANCDGGGDIDIGDLTALINNLFIAFEPLPSCPWTRGHAMPDQEESGYER